MTARPVEAVFFWRYGTTPFHAAYGRVPGSTLYSKDYLQSPGEQWGALDRALGRGQGAKVAVEFRWPGGSVTGEWRKSASDNRGQLAWEYSNAPAPWKVGDPATDPTKAIPGNPSATSEADAEAELQRLEALNVDPWIVAVKLRDEERVLHTRAYLGAPPPGLAWTSLEQLPRVVQEAIRQLPATTGGGYAEVQGHAPLRAPALVARVQEALKRDPNVLLVGPPGTGKTVALEDLRALYEGRVATVTFDPDKWTAAWSEISGLPLGVERKVVSLVFHPSYSYEEFVGGLIPRSHEHGFHLVAQPGPLLSLAHWASEGRREALLILDEFNRGPAAAIFGDTLALLDGDKRDDPGAGRRGATIQRSYVRETMQVDSVYARPNNEVQVGAEVRLPASLRIVAALNSADRSVAPLDAALRRRFAILQVPPDYGVLAEHLGVAWPPAGAFAPSSAEPGDWSADEVRSLAVHLLVALNERIGFVLGQDFLLGHALLWSVAGATTEDLARSLARAFDERIAATLRLTFLDQDEALGAILKAGPPLTTSATNRGTGQGVARWQVPPEDLQAVATPRLEVLSVQEIALRNWPAALRALRAVL